MLIKAGADVNKAMADDGGTTPRFETFPFGIVVAVANKETTSVGVLLYKVFDDKYLKLSLG